MISEKMAAQTLCVGDLPSVAVTQIFSHMSWIDKLNSVTALPVWRAPLQTVAAWPSLIYENESQENIYFVREKRTNLLICIKQFGKYMHSIKLSFGHKIGRLGLQILHAIRDYCCALRLFHVTQTGFRMDVSLIWTRTVVQSISSLLQKCQNLKSVGINLPVIDWSDNPENNIVLEIINNSFSSKVTELELGTNSLFEHEGNLNLLKLFTRLKRLAVRREKINDDILMCLVQNGLNEVSLFQDEELPYDQPLQLGDEFWRRVIQINSTFKVDLMLKYIMVIKASFPSKLPLRSLVLDDLANIITKGVLDHIVEVYKNTIECFTYTNSFLESFEMGDRRLPFALQNMAVECKKLRTLQYGFPLSSTTILLIAKARKLEKLIIPVMEISYEFDWPIQSNWDADFVSWLKTHGQSENMLEKGVSELLGLNWHISYHSLILEDQLNYVQL